jgi:hypothetical protein
MKKKQHKTARELDFNARQLRLLDELPNHAWNIVKAGIAAGYSRAYAISTLKRHVQKNAKLCTAICAKREKITATSLNDVELLKQKLHTIIDDAATTAANRIRCIDILCKIAGVYSEKRVIEDVTRQRELDQAEQQEATLLAGLRLRLCPSHTAPIIDANSGETREKQGDSNGPDGHVQALITDGQGVVGEPPGEADAPQAAAAAPFPSSL